MRIYLLEILAIVLTVSGIGLFVLLARFLLAADYIAATICAVAAFGALKASTDVFRVVGYIAKESR